MIGLSRPVTFGTAAPDNLSLAPRMGADAHRVLAGAGYSEAEIAALLGAGAVLPPPG
jgi:crotonobetainyl-CoA:carnitine CoA-transferase CaiB-like acyl-CoA transferase